MPHKMCHDSVIEVSFVSHCYKIYKYVCKVKTFKHRNELAFITHCTVCACASRITENLENLKIIIPILHIIGELLCASI